MKTVLVTGATGSIGKATALELAKNNNRVILLGRNAEKVKSVQAEIIKITGNSSVDHVVADLSEPASVKAVIEEVKKKTPGLDALVNVAAIFKKNREENSKGHEYTFAANHLGPFMLTNGVLDMIKASKGRIVTVSAPSTTKVNFEDLHGKNKYSGGFMGAFGASKMMNLMFSYALARRLEGSGASSIVYHPGLVKSELTKDMPAFLNFIFKSMSSPPEKAAGMLGKLAVDQNYANANGKFYKVGGKEIKSSQYSYDKDLQEKLWDVSAKLST
jgi:NAD(P)-dependent dehydrogenase (short-subunit alcohol dehydrogenase family)